jgi:hypothetical protein
VDRVARADRSGGHHGSPDAPKARGAQ